MKRLAGIIASTVLCAVALAAVSVAPASAKGGGGGGGGVPAPPPATPLALNCTLFGPVFNGFVPRGNGGWKSGIGTHLGAGINILNFAAFDINLPLGGSVTWVWFPVQGGAQTLGTSTVDAIHHTVFLMQPALGLIAPDMSPGDVIAVTAPGLHGPQTILTGTLN